jgi:biopolymer transport protein ExbD
VSLIAEISGDEGVIEHKRLRERRGRPRPRIALNLTAMIDVVFLLLIYFMAATSFKLGEEIFRMDLPQRGAAAAPDPFALDAEPLRVSIASTGTMRDAYRLHLSGPYAQPLSFDDFYEFLRQRRMTPHSPVGLFAPDHPIVIEPSRTTRWEHVIDTFNAAVRAEFTNVTFAAPS